MAGQVVMELENGGIANYTANYLNVPSTPVWANESLTIWGENGFIESLNGGLHTRFVLKDKDMGPVDISEPPISHFEMFLDQVRGERTVGEELMPLEDELHPTRMILRAKEELK